MLDKIFSGEFLEKVYWNNSMENYLIALGVFIGLFLVFWLFDKFLLYYFRKQAEKSKTEYDDILVGFLEGISWFFYIYLALYLGSLFLELPEILNNILYYVLIGFIVFYASRGLFRIVDFFVGKESEKRQKKGKSGKSMVKVMGIIIKILLGAVALLMFLSNLGIEITPLIASLGVGGIALALAAQAVLGDLFSAFTIYFDKPFKEGDFIIIGKDMGVVKKIGIKSTRVQTLEGQELVVSNSELTSTRINNYGKMQKRRVVMNFGVEYSTPVKKLEKIDKIVEKIINKMEDVELDRVHFKEFGDFSLNYETVFYINTGDYNKYMDIREKINLELMREFQKEKIVFAFPTQTIFLEKNK